MTRLAHNHLFELIDRPDHRPDSELLGAFIARNDPEAFAALVRRHGPVVLAVCRRVLGVSSDADDAFQAVFLALVRDARSIRDPSVLPAWLHRVALRVARRAAARRRQAAPLPPEVVDPADPFAGVMWRDLRRVLDEELDRLPERYRSPLVFCLLDGCTQDEAAARLGYSLNTFKRRLEAGRGLLRARLLRRGVAPVVLAANILDPAGLRAVVPLSLTAELARLTSFTGTVPDRLAALLPAPGRSTVAVGLSLAVVIVAAAARVTVPAAPPLHAVTTAAPADTAPTDLLPVGATARYGDTRFRHPGPIHSSALSPDGTRLATLSTRVLQVLDVGSGRPVFRDRLTDPVDFATPDLVFSTDGKYLASTVNRKLTLIWEAATGRVILRLAREESAGRLCRFTPAGHLVLTTDRWSLQKPGRTQVVEIPSGREVGSIPVGGVAVLSPDGQRFAKSESDGPDGADCVLVGDTNTGRSLLRLPASAVHGCGRDGVAFSPDGTWLAVVHEGKEIQVWETDKGKKLAVASLPGRVTFGDNSYYKVGFFSNGTTSPPTLWVAGQGDFYYWGLSHGELVELGRLDPYWASHITGAHLLKGGRTLFLAGTDGLIHRWDRANDREQELTLDAHHAPPRIALTPDGTLLLVGDSTRRVEVCDAGTGKVLRTLTRPARGELGSSLASLAVSPDGRRVALGLATGAVRVLRLADGIEEQVYRRGGGGSENWIQSAMFSPDGRQLVVSGDNGVWAFDAPTGRVEWALPGRPRVNTRLPDGKLLVGFEGATRLVVIEPPTGKVLTEFPVLPGGPHPFDQISHPSVLAASPDGRLFALVDREGVKVRRTRDGGLWWSAGVKEPGPVAWSIGGGTHGVLSLAFSPDGRWLAGGRYDGGVSVWEVLTGKELCRFRGHDEPVHAVVFAADARSLFSAGGDGFAYRWALNPDLARVVGLPAAELWTAAAGDDPAKAFDAAAALVATEPNRRFLRQHLPPVKADATTNQVRGWMADLGSPDFLTREAASRELRGRARLFERPLREAAEGTTNPEVRARLMRILVPLDSGLMRDELGAARLVHAAELAGTAEAEVLLKDWAGGAACAILTAEARSALDRLGEPGARRANKPGRDESLPRRKSR